MTYAQALQTYLPLPIADAAINNRIRQEGEGSERNHISCLNQALSDAFIWRNTPEGQKYWENINGEFLKHLKQYYHDSKRSK